MVPGNEDQSIWRAIGGRPVTAKQIADQMGATARQVQLWTDERVIECLTATFRRGRGSRRLYSPRETAYASAAAVLAGQNIPVSRMQIFVAGIREVVGKWQKTDDANFRRNFGDALQGKIESWFYADIGTIAPLMELSAKDVDLVGGWFPGWVSIPEFANSAKGLIVLNVKLVLAPFWPKEDFEGLDQNGEEAATAK